MTTGAVPTRNNFDPRVTSLPTSKYLEVKRLGGICYGRGRLAEGNISQNEPARHLSRKHLGMKQPNKGKSSVKPPPSSYLAHASEVVAHHT
ncbi:hypothetical protein FNV43_RR27255 [Rhamnella rubrinervis]|uniref:Uncharacterized protein n=1 Tax=Rhamnella rubrinervis TaxID=2594499 RepID=A0A8K0DK81_9ROSA|nr:hypothetical protein FNV43_RR27255 [Rhamnella rubrinervis]